MSSTLVNQQHREQYRKNLEETWLAKCDVFIISRIIFSLTFARGRNNYISFSINIRTNKLEHDLRDMSPFLSNFQLTCTVAEKDMSTFGYSSASHIASSKKAFVRLLKSRPDVVYSQAHVYTRIQSRSCTTILTSSEFHDDNQLSPILLNFLRRISHLNCLKSTLHFWTGIDWTLPWHQHSFTSSTFLPSITSTSHSSIISHCPSVNLLRFDRAVMIDLKRTLSLLSSQRCFLKFVKFVLQSPLC